MMLSQKQLDWKHFILPITNVAVAVIADQRLVAFGLVYGGGLIQILGLLLVAFNLLHFIIIVIGNSPLIKAVLAATSVAGMCLIIRGFLAWKSNFEQPEGMGLMLVVFLAGLGSTSVLVCCVKLSLLSIRIHLSHLFWLISCIAVFISCLFLAVRFDRFAMYSAHAQIAANLGLSMVPGENIIWKNWQIDQLYMSGRKISDDDLKQIGQIKTATLIDLTASSIPDSGLNCLLPNEDLRSLSLARTQITDGALLEVVQFHKLSSLNLASTSITDDGVRILADMSELHSLDVSQTSISDIGLAYLESLEKLHNLNLHGTKVSSEGIRRLQDRLPHCSIQARTK